MWSLFHLIILFQNRARKHRFFLTSNRFPVFNSGFNSVSVIINAAVTSRLLNTSLYFKEKIPKLLSSL